MTLYIDCDGVLTNGKLYIDHTGEKMFKAFNSRDIRAIRELVANGIRVVILSADDSPINISFAKNTGAEFYCRRDKSDIDDLRDGKPYMAVGDDVWDMSLLKSAFRAFAPSDCDIKIANMKDVEILTSRGGHGVIAELVPTIINYMKQEINEFAKSL